MKSTLHSNHCTLFYSKLHISDVPVCLNSEPIVHGVGKGEMVDVICDVVANPNVDAFHWAFNNSAGLIHVPPARYTCASFYSNGVLLL